MHGESGLVAGDNAGKWVRCLKLGDGVGGGRESLNACWCLLSLTNVIYTQKIHTLLFWPICFFSIFLSCLLYLQENLQRKSI